jgi:hypothetical protein
MGIVACLNQVTSPTFVLTQTGNTVGYSSMKNNILIWASAVCTKLSATCQVRHRRKRHGSPRGAHVIASRIHDTLGRIGWGLSRLLLKSQANKKTASSWIRRTAALSSPSALSSIPQLLAVEFPVNPIVSDPMY